MASEDREVKIAQQKKAVVNFDARKSLLAAEGLDEKAIAKDPVLKALGAKVKKSRQRIAAIDGHEAHAKAMAEKNTKASKDKKKAKGQPKQGGGKKKKK